MTKTQWRNLVKDRNSWPVLLSIGMALSFSLYILFQYLTLPLLDQFGFRQTQTAISAYWMAEHFSLLNYETPVIGMPWVIPFEFPSYQALVVLVWKLFSFLSLDAVTRLVSWSMGIACAWPIYCIMTRYIDRLAACILLCLYISSPFFVFWLRTSMIETTALFFSLMFMWRLIRLGDSPSLYAALLAAVWGALAVTTKVTTIAPYMLCGGLHIFCMNRNTFYRSWRLFLLFALPFFVTIAALAAWTVHSDAVKAMHPVAQALTSKALSGWNFGTFVQKTDPVAWLNLLQRLLPELYGSMFLFGLLSTFLFFCRRRHFLFALGASGLFFLPVLIFTNLHFVHNYYQVSNALFLLAFTAIAIHGALVATERGILLWFTPVLVVIFAFNFDSMYKQYIVQSIYNQPYTVGKTLSLLVPHDGKVVILGADWSSETQYYAQRRGFSMPKGWISDEKITDLLDSMPEWLGSEPSAVVIYDQATDKNVHSSTFSQMGKYFPARLATLHKTRVSNSTLYYHEPEETVSLLDATFTGIAPGTVLSREQDGLKIVASTEDPFFEIPLPKVPPSAQGKRYFLRLEIHGSAGGLQLFYRTSPKEEFTEERSLHFSLQEGNNLILLPENITGPTLRLDPGNKPGTYCLTELSLLLVPAAQ